MPEEFPLEPSDSPWSAVSPAALRPESCQSSDSVPRTSAPIPRRGARRPTTASESTVVRIPSGVLALLRRASGAGSRRGSIACSGQTPQDPPRSILAHSRSCAARNSFRSLAPELSGSTLRTRCKNTVISRKDADSVPRVHQAPHIRSPAPTRILSIHALPEHKRTTGVA